MEENCEAAFMDDEGNYCAVDILHWREDRQCYDIYEIKNTAEVSDRSILDAAFQAYLIRKTGLRLDRIYIVYHSSEPYDMKEVTDQVDALAQVIGENIGRLGKIKDQPEEYCCYTGAHCACPYECWYFGYCRDLSRKTSNCCESLDDK